MHALTESQERRRVASVMSVVMLASVAVACGSAETAPAENAAVGSDVAGENEEIRQAAVALCDRIAALECVDPGAGGHAACVQGWLERGESKRSGECDAGRIVSMFECLGDSTACPAGWGPERLAISALLSDDGPALDACVDDEFARACLGVDYECEPAPPGTLVSELDLDGDGQPEALPAETEDRRVICTHDGSEDKLLVELPPVVVQPGSETFTCAYGRWTGPDIGIVSQRFFSDAATDHHTLVLKVPEGATPHVPDGQPFDCLDLRHEIGKPVFHAMVELDQAIGAQLSHGQRYYIERHTINVLPHPIVINATSILTLVPIDELEGLAHWYVMGPEEVVVPPGPYGIKTSCVWPVDTSILAVAGHIHERGARFALDWTSASGTKRVLDVSPWLEEYVSTSATMKSYAPGEFQVKAGDVFTTWCYWDNHTGQTLTTPQEMCNTFGAASPLDEPLDCTSEYEEVPFEAAATGTR